MAHGPFQVGDIIGPSDKHKEDAQIDTLLVITEYHPEKDEQEYIAMSLFPFWKGDTWSQKGKFYAIHCKRAIIEQWRVYSLQDCAAYEVAKRLEGGNGPSQ